MTHESPVLDKKEKVIDRPKYSETEEDYLKGLRKRLERARDARETEHDEFDGMSYSTHYELNERSANTYIKPKRNKEDTNFQSGTVRQKLFAFLASLVNLDLSGDISAYDSEGLEIQGVGDALEDVIFKTKELDNDDEKKYLRQYELLKHGTVFVEEIWDERKVKDKDMKDKFNGEIKKTWNERIKKAFARPTRNIIPAINVYLGDMTKYDISEQPFVFTVQSMPYEEAKAVFGSWERWDKVPRKLQKTTNIDNDSPYNINWRLIDSQEDVVEVVRYQDKWNNEFAVLLNGVLMTPVGLPFPWKYEEYNIAQQNLEPIHSRFAYGKSFVARIRNKTALLDEFMRLAILKTQKSFMPPYINLSGRVLSNRVLMPGKISHGLQPNSLVPINEKEAQGLSSSELAMIQEIQENINTETVSPTFQGQQASGNPTATEIIELQRQAKMILGLTVFSMSMLEWKLEWLRLKNVLQHWFHEEDPAAENARNVLRGRYRQTSVERNIDGEGRGRRIVVPTTEIPSDETIRRAEDALSEEQGMPIRLIFLNPREIMSSKLTWQIAVRPREKKTSEVSKLLFRSFLQDVVPLQPNISYLQERAATVWEEDPQKLFAPNPEAPMPEAPGEQQNIPGSQPSPQSASGRELQTQLKVNA